MCCLQKPQFNADHKKKSQFSAEWKFLIIDGVYDFSPVCLAKLKIIWPLYVTRSSDVKKPTSETEEKPHFLKKR